MKIQLDTQNKVIRLDETVNLKELYKLLGKILPNKEWEEYKLETSSQIVWTNPIFVSPYIQPYSYPWWGYHTPVYGTTLEFPEPVVTTNQGVYNLEVQI